MREFLERVLPGSSPRIVELRGQVIGFCASPTARAVLVDGPIGVGKSTLARAMAMLKRVAPLKADVAKDILDDVPFVGPNLIDLNAIPWYVELPLTGLASELAESQLFGTVKGAYTGASDRPGVFELAKYGRRNKDDSIPEGALVTGGVVFLDEVGDLSGSHQAKLLPVLSGGAFYRLGEEGAHDKDIVFRGVIVAATWKPLSPTNFRPDLLSRLSAYRIRVPSLAERMEDFNAIVTTVETSARTRLSQAIQGMIEAEPLADRDYWLKRQVSLPCLTDEDRRFLLQIDWSRRGNLRGLTSVVDLVVNRGVSAEEAVDVAYEPVEKAVDISDPVDSIIEALFQRPTGNFGLAGHVRAVEQEMRERLHERLRRDLPLQRRLATHLGIRADEFSKTLGDLVRNRGTR